MSITLDGIVFDEAQFAGGGYLDLVTVNGVQYPRWQAFLVAALRDAAKILVGSSTSSVAVGTGSKSFVLAIDIPFNAGGNVKIVDIAAPTTNWMFGEVTSYTSATKTLVVNVTKTAGGGTLANWRVIGAGPQGEAGAPGSAPYGATLPSALGTSATGSNADAARIDHVHPAADLATAQVTGTLPVSKGGTGGTTAAAARAGLGATSVGDAVFVAASAAAARNAIGAIGVDVQVFTSSGTWNKPAGASVVFVEVIGGGGGGGGGRGDAVGGNRGGGGGGGGGAREFSWFKAADLGGTETVTVAAGGGSGAGGSSANGALGGGGGASSFGSHLRAPGGNGGGLGNNGTGGSGGAGGVHTGSDTFGNGATGGVGGTFGAGQNGSAASFSGGGGGGGGSMDSGNIETAGGNGGVGFARKGTATTQANAGASNGGAGSAGSASSTHLGNGGGGGGSQDSGTGGAGGDGGAPGGGGGGGGGGTTTGGAGGIGGRGEVRVISI